MRTKPKEIFRLESFRGLDKENKPLKVEPFRASEGFNFLIDSGTIKTRPAINIKREFSVELEQDDYIIDWYNFNGVTLYVTKKHFIVEDKENNVLFNDESIDARFIKNNFDTFDFENKKPLFREEKDALFIFGLDKVYVFGVLRSEFSETNEYYCLYDIAEKPNISVSVNQDINDMYYDLPKPYEPTIFIGGNRFEDTNHLSRVNKYHLFAGSSDVRREADDVIYDLPTHYNEEKHGSFSYIKDNLKVNLYNNKFDEFKVVPVFMGISDENFESENFSDYGDIVEGKGSEEDPVKIESKFYPSEPFEYSYSSGSLDNVIRENFNLDASTFFHSKVRGISKTVFQYIAGYLGQVEEDIEGWLNNKVFVFEMPYQANEIIYDSETNFITKQGNQMGTKKVYVQLRKYVEIPFEVENIVLSDDENRYLNNPPLLEISDSFVFPDYPNYSETPNYEVDYGTPTEKQDELPIDASSSIINSYKNSIRNNFISEAKMYLHQNQENYVDGDIIGFRKRRWFFYIRVLSGAAYSQETKISMTLTAKVIVNRETVDFDLVDIEFNRDEGAFEFRIKDFFFDYNKQPSIEVVTKFEKNEDYDLIAKTRFGVNFGSENRLFLAGHPDYPNLDRYNVSNALLGNNEKNQSYEMSYFPSRNFRVVGGKGAINGYVVASDTQLYVTKEKFINDSVLFIRERIMGEEGRVDYFEYKTNIDKTPLNNECITNFYNDIVMLTEDGLFAIEIASNVLTNQRLLRLRSGFINKDLSKYINKETFIKQEKHLLYIFADKTIFVADARFAQNNPESELENISYEIVKWKVLQGFRTAKKEGDTLTLLSKDENFYEFKQGETHDQTTIKVKEEFFFQNDIENYGDVFEISSEMKDKFLEYQETYSDQDETPKIKFKDYNGFYYRFGKQEYMEYSNQKITFLSPLIYFVNFKEGDNILLLDTSDNKHFVTIESVSEENDFIIINQTLENFELKELYIYFNHNEFFVNLIEWENYSGFTVSPTVIEDNEDAKEAFYPTKIIEDNPSGLFSGLVYFKKPIEMKWVSSILDLNNDVMEKTMFRVNINAKKQEQENQLFFGYRTSKVIRDDTHGDKFFQRVMDLSNPFDFENFNFNIMGIQTFSEVGSSFPMKENNFLYIQFVLVGFGQIEINNINILFKYNRSFKSIG